MKNLIHISSIFALMLIALFPSQAIGGNSSQPDANESFRHIQAPQSPLLMPSIDYVLKDWSKDWKQIRDQGVFFPGTYGGVTAIKLDLDKIGTDEMLTVFFRGDYKDGLPLFGADFKLHSDETFGSGKPSASRRVILVEEEQVDRGNRGTINRKRVICYTVSYQTDTFDELGRPASSEGTTYQFTISEIEDDLVVKYLIKFGKRFPNKEYPDLTGPPETRGPGTESNVQATPIPADPEIVPAGLEGLNLSQKQAEEWNEWLRLNDDPSAADPAARADKLRSILREDQMPAFEALMNWGNMPLKWYDEQGSQIVSEIKKGFQLPRVDESEGEKICHERWAYFEEGEWQTGSTINIYGVKKESMQDEILTKVRGLVRSNNFSDVRVVFYDVAKYLKKGNVIRRLASPELRKERIHGEK